ncbi:Abi family protein [Pseudomonas putida]|uniref:Abi family protein n=1 Tax=Pseudomonas putida TaxID=303 RepID=UPI0009BA427C|nr:Abi family protein [Pseudomonas putida]USX37512.1 Abi family protein [Pseudomonas putida]
MYNPTPCNIITSLDAISVPRLSTYRQFFNPANDEELYGIYCWNEVLGSNFLRLIGSVEVTLRNKFHLHLSQHAHTVQWPYVGSPDSNDWYSHANLRGKSEDKVKAITHDARYDQRSQRKIYTPKPHFVSPNNVVSSMTFGFWAPLLDLNLPWKTLIPQIFSKHRYAATANYWNQARIGTIYERLNAVRDIRNRAAHFEPIWKIKDMPEEIRAIRGVTPRIEYLAPVNETEALVRLQIIYDRITQLLYWMSPERAADHQSSDLHKKTSYLLTQAGLDQFKRGRAARAYPISSLAKTRRMKPLLQERMPFQLMHKGSVIGHIYPE